MTVRGHEMRDVVLVEADEPDAATARDEGPSPLWRYTRRTLHRWWPVAAGLAVLVVGSSFVAADRARDRAERVAALPGVLRPVDAGVHELWRAPLRGWGDVTPVPGGYVLAGADTRGDVAVARVDAATGEVRWTVPLPEVGVDDALSCTVPDVGDGPGWVVCAVGTVPTGDPDDPTPAGLTTRLLVLDARTGDRAGTRALEGAAASVSTLGPDLLVAEVRADGRAAVTREDPRTGDVRWTWTSPGTLPGPADQRYAYLQVDGDVILVHGPGTWALRHDGTEIAGWTARGEDASWWLDVAVAPDGRFVVGGYQQSAGPGDPAAPRYEVVQRDGTRDFTLPGPLLTPAVDDGSAAGTYLALDFEESDLVGVDASDGRELWTVPGFGTGGGWTVVLDGRLVTTDSTDLWAVDLRSGEELWRTPLGRVGTGELLTDGSLVLVVTNTLEEGRGLAAFDPVDGSTRWYADLPDDLDMVWVVEGRLLGVAGSELVAFG